MPGWAPGDPPVGAARGAVACLVSCAALLLVQGCEVPFTWRTVRADAGLGAADAGEPPDAQVRAFPGYARRQKLTLRNAARTEPLVDFPVLVALEPAQYAPGDFEPSGGDVLFVDDDGVTPLAHEVESFDGTQGVFWVKVPRVEPTDDDFVWMYFRSPGTVVAQDPPAVWSNGFVGVWHFQADPAGLQAVRDSSPTGAHGTANGLTEQDRRRSPVGTGLFFDGTGQWVRVPSGETDPLAITGGEITLEALAYRQFLPEANWSVLVGRQSGTTSLDGYALGGISGAADRLFMGYGGEVRAQAACLPLEQWVYAAGTRDASRVSVFVDGALLQSEAVGVIHIDSNDVTIGGEENNATDVPTELWKGGIDEVRISNVARSPEWIAAQGEGFRKTLVVFGAVESL